MASFPQRFDGEAALFPLQRNRRFPVEVQQFDDWTEQRWKLCAPTTDFVLQLDSITEADRDAIEDFFETTKGGFDTTWDIEIGGETFENMMFVDDRLVWTEGAETPQSYSTRIPIRQAKT